MQDNTLEDKITTIKEWLDTGSINIFGLPMSGKDTQGVKLAEALDGKFLSSGMIIRAMEAETRTNYSKDGDLIPTDIFYEWVLPFLEKPELRSHPLILSSIGRWTGEEDKVMSATAKSGHETKAVVVLNISEADVEERYHQSRIDKDRGTREDDRNLETFRNRLKEFSEKTLPVLRHYNELGLLVEVAGDDTRENVFANIIEALYKKALGKI